ncbi:MAG: SWF/SNF helicase family protein [Sandaracinaceae bacterium]|nr:SWF/SNF helicase family protein [Sandaracinaceae bacterium]
MRRLKREINELDEEKGRQPRFPYRQLRKIHLDFSKKETALNGAFAEFRASVKRAVAKRGRTEQVAGAFAVEVLNKRLLSSPHTFADSWYRYLEGTRDPEEAKQTELFAAHRASEEDVADDLEKEDRGRFASRTAGAWMKPLLGALSDEIAAVTAAVEDLGVAVKGDRLSRPKHDARFDALVDLIEDRLREGRRWNDLERVIVFTEYKTTLDDLEERLREKYGEGADGSERIRVLYGGMDAAKRRAIKDAFNDPAEPVRVLIATDAASEGLNLQETARLLLHYEIPWNPSRLEQRNGRLDRHGQARDVTVYHFASEDDADLKFLSRVVEKVHQIREDLGTLGELFDAAFQRRFVDLEDGDSIEKALDAKVESERGAHEVPAETAAESNAQVDEERVRRLRGAIDLSPHTLRDTLEVALGLEVGQPRLEGPDARGRFRLLQPIPPRWQALIDDTLRLPLDGSALSGALPSMVFDAAHFIEEKLGRPVFRPAKDTVLLHLGHPLFRHALGNFARLRFPGRGDGVSATRWAVRRGPIPKGSDVLLLLTVEEMAVNALREPFHHWVRTLRIPVTGEKLGAVLPWSSPHSDGATAEPPEREDIDGARELWEALEYDVRDLLRARAAELESIIQRALDAGRDAAITDARAMFEGRIQEVRESIRKTTIKSIEKERDELIARRSQAFLFPGDGARVRAEDHEPRRGAEAPPPPRRRAPRDAHARARARDEPPPAAPLLAEWGWDPGLPALRRDPPAGGAMTDLHDDWWASLNHGGLLIAPGEDPGALRRRPAPTLARAPDRLRRDVVRMLDDDAYMGGFLDQVFESLLELPAPEWLKASDVGAEWSHAAVTGEAVRPRRVWRGPNGEVLPLFATDGKWGRGAPRIGVGKGRRAVSRVIEWLRNAHIEIAVLTNGRRIRLIHAAADYDAFCEWDIELWFDEGAPGPQVTALRRLLGRPALLAPTADARSPLLQAIHESRRGQGELSAVLGERVRQAVELLIRSSSSQLEPIVGAGNVTPNDAYIAATRIVMRLVVVLFAEARELLPRVDPIYHGSYGLQGLREGARPRCGRQERAPPPPPRSLAAVARSLPARLPRLRSRRPPGARVWRRPLPTRRPAERGRHLARTRRVRGAEERAHGRRRASNARAAHPEPGEGPAGPRQHLGRGARRLLRPLLGVHRYPLRGPPRLRAAARAGRRPDGLPRAGRPARATAVPPRRHDGEGARRAAEETEDREQEVRPLRRGGER